MTKVLDGQGATKERKRHSNIKSGVRSITRGGIPIGYGDRDIDHCALDRLLNGGFIEQDQYDAGIHLRALYYTFEKSGVSCCEEKSGGHEGDLETPTDKAYERHKKALQSIDEHNRALVQSVCCDDQTVYARYGLAMDIQQGLNDLIRFFTCKRNKNIV